MRNAKNTVFCKFVLAVIILLSSFQWVNASTPAQPTQQTQLVNGVPVTTFMSEIISNNRAELTQLEQSFTNIKAKWALLIQDGVVTESEIRSIEFKTLEINRQLTQLITDIQTQNDDIIKLTNVDSAQQDLQNRLRGLKDNSEATSETYLLRLKQIHYLVTENKAIIFDIKALQTRTSDFQKIVSHFRFNFSTNYMFIKHDPLFGKGMLTRALDESFSYSTDLKAQFTESKAYLVQQMKSTYFWLSGFLIALLAILYFWVSHKIIQQSIRWRNTKLPLAFKFFLVGLIPSYFISINIGVILAWLPYANNVIYDTVINSLVDSLASILMMTVVAHIILRRYRQYREKCLTPTIAFICATAFMTFINGVDSFALNTPAILAFPAAITNFVNFMFGFLYTGIMLWLLIRILQVKERTTNKNAAYNIILIGSFIIAALYPLIIFLGLSNFINILIINLIQTLVLAMMAYATYHISVPAIGVVINKIRKMANLSPLSIHSVSKYWVRFFVMTTILIIAIPLILLTWGFNPHWVNDVINTILFKGIMVGSTAVSITYILKALFVGIFAYSIVKVINLFLNRKIYPYTAIQEGTIVTLDTMMGYLSISLGVIFFFYALGITGTSLTFLASAFVLGISFGLQEIFKNLISGIILITERPMKIGDWVHADGKMGVVKKIQLRATVLETFNRETLIVPNSQFITKTISNEMYNPTSRLVLNIEVSYNEDPKKVKEILLDIASKTPNLLSSPEPSAVFTGFNASSLAFALRVFCHTNKQLAVGDHIRTEVLLRFREENIEIPYQKIDIQIKEVIQTKPLS